MKSREKNSKTQVAYELSVSFLFHILQYWIHKKNHLYILLKFIEISF